MPNSQIFENFAKLPPKNELPEKFELVDKTAFELPENEKS